MGVQDAAAAATIIDFESFYRDQHPRLIAVGLAFTGDRDRSLDAAQETLTRALRHWPDVVGAVSPAAWTRRTLVNLLIDDGRRMRRWRRVAPTLPVHEVTVDALPDLALRQAIIALPPQQRAAIVLHHLDDLPIRDVAFAMGVAEGTVKSTLSQARAALASRLGEEPT